MSKFDDIVRPDRVTILSGGAQPAVITRVQASLYARLRAKWGHSMGGRLGWLLIRSATPAHRDHEDALAALRSRTPAELDEFAAVVRATKRAAPAGETGDAWSQLASAILAAVETAAAAAIGDS